MSGESILNESVLQNAKSQLNEKGEGKNVKPTEQVSNYTCNNSKETKQILSNDESIVSTDAVINNKEGDADDPYAYINRDNFTSEKFKLEIRNLPKYYGYNELKKLINNKLKLNANKVKCPYKNSKWLYICFRDNEAKLKALDILNGFNWKGKKLNASDAKPVPDPLVMKRKQNALEPQNKRPKMDSASQEEQLKNSVTPYWNIKYSDQLENKQNSLKTILKDFGDQLIAVNPLIKEKIEENKLKYDGLPCELWDIRHADKLTGYRNKCEFTVGIDEVTNLPIVGFRLGSYVSGYIGVAPIDGLVHIHDRMKLAAKVYEKFVRSSNLDVYNPELHVGHFKQLCVRLGVTSNELMLIAGVFTQMLNDDQLQQLKRDIITFFNEGEGKEANVTSLYFQSLSRKSSDPNNKLEHLHGDKHITEKVLDLKFNISPDAFFQVNTEGANILYKTVIELANPTQESTVVDVCCGTGTIGICFAQKCQQVLGVEIVPGAVEDARANCTLNNINNCTFFCGKAEDILHSVMNRATSDDIIAVVDPPRAGLPVNAIMQLRKMKKITKLVYVSCDAKAAIKNFIDLGRMPSKTMQLNPLLPVKAVAVDMFPFTKHCELLIYFERLEDNLIKKDDNNLA